MVAAGRAASVSMSASRAVCDAYIGVGLVVEKAAERAARDPRR